MIIDYLNVTEIDDETLSEHFAIMDADAKDRVLSLRDDNKRRQKIAADMLCRRMISEKCGIPSESIVFGRTEKGKPYTVNTDLFFSISHSDNIVVCAISENEIGIDVEKIRNVRLRIAEKFASPEELTYIGDNLNRFFEIWTLKEAFFKCKGTGLGADIRSVTFDIDGGITCSENGYSLQFADITDGYICSVCIKN
ncbi:MAG: 4'-phosphopantetheinyl transferase superfamily protein [Clostridia bacterium]|nr:4'-phosphopantetheinyl transferase superfamily protein [Clostridia bacterium]